MRTPLFPRDDKTHVDFRQGATGDCYILATLDCLLNTGVEDRHVVKSMFREVAGGVELRIKRNPASAHLDRKIEARVHEIPEEKFKYRLEGTKEDGYDVFFLSDVRLDKIDATSEVKSNSLAVKIFERISSYYYVGPKPTAVAAAVAGGSGASSFDITMSIAAHNAPVRHDGTSTKFMGDLLGIIADDLNPRANPRIYEIIAKLKTILPDSPVYISMAYGMAAADGMFHDRHALRLDKVRPSTVAGSGGYEFTLVNPWDNTKTETFTLTDLKARNPRFSIFSADAKKHDFINLLLQLPTDDGKYVTTKPDLFTMMLEIKDLKPAFSAEEIGYCIALHKKMPSIVDVFKGASPAQKGLMIARMVDSKGGEAMFGVGARPAPAVALPAAPIMPKPMPAPPIEVKKPSIASSPKEILEGILENAIQAKVKTGISKSEAAMSVRRSVAAYYFDSDATHLTRAGDLRSLLGTATIMSESTGALIRATLSPTELLLGALSIYGNPPESTVIPPSVTNYIRDSRGALPKDFISQLVADAGYTKPRDLFNHIFVIERINPALAESLFQQAKENLPGLFSPSVKFDEFARTVAIEADNSFKAWFAIKAIPPNVRTMIGIINAFNVSYDSCKTLSEIENSRNMLQWSLLDPITHASKIGLRKPLDNPEIKAAYDAKMSEINAKAAVRAEILAAKPSGPEIIKGASDGIVNAKAAVQINKLTAQQYLTDIGFDRHIAAIDSKIKNLTARGHTDVSGVLQGIITARDRFLTTNDKVKFKNECETSINANLGVLEQHRGIKLVIAPLVDGLLALLAAFHIITLAQKESGSFFMKTESAQLAKNFKTALSEVRGKDDDPSPAASDDSSPDIGPRR